MITRSALSKLCRLQNRLSRGIASTINGQAQKHKKIADDMSTIRTHGHKNANINPLVPSHPQVPLNTGSLADKYTGNVGWEFMHLESLEERTFVQSLIEADDVLSVQDCNALAKLMLQSEAFDQFMAKRFGQVKRYGLEGGESMIVAVNEVIRNLDPKATMVIEMPHRGRLNLMTGLLGYPAEALFAKLKGHKELPETIPGSGDVLSHLWLDSKLANGSRAILLPNPSHLELGNPVQMGLSRALADLGSTVFPLQIHGDAAFSGQGVIMECLLLSQLPGYKVDGTVHLIVNNQLGFTTPSHFGRSSRYASDPMKMINAPVFHVNGDNPEAVRKAMDVAIKYRNEFKKDVCVDLLCYRKMGHNELDEPSFTQPIMYNMIRNRDLPGTNYAKNILKMGSEGIEEIKAECYQKLDHSLSQADSYKFTTIGLQDGFYSFNQHKDNPTGIFSKNSSTGHETEALKQIAQKSVSIPETFSLHPRLKKFHCEARLNSLAQDSIDWATAEAVAFGSLLQDGIKVRLSGQDVGRGTFSHRHVIVYDQQTNESHVPFKALGDVNVIDSPLSELGVMGFEYGHSLASPKQLNLWEAQFGDFFNGAQMIIDTFISSGEQKWGLQSGLVLLLPHGYNGAGPEHSTCRIERFLQMCDESLDGSLPELGVNMFVAQPTTPANYFHLLRRQVHRNYRKPLIVASPKQLLRLPAAVSKLSELSKDSQFREIIYDNSVVSSAKNIIFTSGEIAYDLEKEFKSPETLIVRLEQLCPFPLSKISSLLAQTKAKKFIFCQPEPENMGSLQFVKPRLEKCVGSNVLVACRKASAAPATGYPKKHSEQSHSIMQSVREFLK